MEIHPSNLQRQKISKSTRDLEPKQKEVWKIAILRLSQTVISAKWPWHPRYRTTTCDLDNWILLSCITSIYPKKTWVSWVSYFLSKEHLTLCFCFLWKWHNIIEVSQKKQALMSLLPTQKNPSHERKLHSTLAPSPLPRIPVVTGVPVKGGLLHPKNLPTTRLITTQNNPPPDLFFLHQKIHPPPRYGSPKQSKKINEIRTSLSTSILQWKGPLVV